MNEIIIANECGGSGPHTGNEVRVLPHSKTPLHGNDILCRACFSRAIADRQQANLRLGAYAQYDLPAWEDLEISKP